MSTDLEERTELNESTETVDPIFTHIIPGTPDKTANEVLMEAMINGTVVVALCGYAWVPHRDPMNYPVCPQCIEIVQFDSQFPKQ